MADYAKKVSKKALAKSFRNWYYGNLTCFSQEHMQIITESKPVTELSRTLIFNKKIQNTNQAKRITAPAPMCFGRLLSFIHPKTVFTNCFITTRLNDYTNKSPRTVHNMYHPRA